MRKKKAKKCKKLTDPVSRKALYKALARECTKHFGGSPELTPALSQEQLNKKEISHGRVW
jgi:hypothetical protein